MTTKLMICDCDHENVNMEKSVFNEAGYDFKWLNCQSQEEVIEQCQEAVALLNQYVKFDENVFRHMPNLKFIVRYGVGVDNINLEDANKYGIQICNVPDYGMNEVADQATALLLSLYRKIWIHGNSTKEKEWNYAIGPKIHRPEKLTVGIIGTGRIGQEFAKRVHAFGFNIVAFDEYFVNHTKEEDRLEYIEYLNDLDELYSRSDFISLHCGLSESNKHMINKDSISKMKDGAYIINVSRGGLINEEDLYQALKSGKISGAGLDVFNKEPIEANNPLLTLDNCIITPHSSWYSEEASLQLKHDCAALAVAFLRGQIMDDKFKKNRVNNK